MNTTTTTILADQYIAAYKAWTKAYEKAYKAIGPNGNEAESIASANAYRAMVDAREALMNATK